MRRAVLAYLACPRCQAGLQLSSVTLEDAEHVMQGQLGCERCPGVFPIKDGVPILVGGDVDPLKTETAARFAVEWTRWTDLREYYEKQFLGWVAPLTREDFVGRVVFEGGCGKGRHAELVARFGARDIVSVDLGASVFVAFQNTRALPNAHIVLGDLTHPPVRPIFDLAFSVGVLHHLPEPEVGARSVASVVRADGRVVYWVYGLENNEWIKRFVDPLRRTITSKLPYRALRALSAGPAALMWLAIRLLYKPGSDGHGPAGLPYGEYLASMQGFPFDELELIVFDQLVTPVAYYLPRAEVERWFEGGGFENVEIRWHNQMSWTATAVVRRAADADSVGSSARGIAGSEVSRTGEPLSKVVNP